MSVFLDKGKKLHTTRSWEFLGLEKNGRIPKESLMHQARFGEDVIIANLDTGNFLSFEHIHHLLDFLPIYEYQWSTSNKVSFFN